MTANSQLRVFVVGAHFENETQSFDFLGTTPAPNAELATARLISEYYVKSNNPPAPVRGCSVLELTKEILLDLLAVYEGDKPKLSVVHVPLGVESAGEQSVNNAANAAPTRTEQPCTGGGGLFRGPFSDPNDAA